MVDTRFAQFLYGDIQLLDAQKNPPLLQRGGRGVQNKALDLALCPLDYYFLSRRKHSHMFRLISYGCTLSLLFAWQASAADHRVEVLEEAAPADAISEEIAAQLSPTGLRIIRGTSRKVCDIWLCRQWELPEESDPEEEVVYPFQPGQLIGVVRYNNKGGDFRDQEIVKGVYTLRYAHQPVDGDHIGTAPSRDFLVLLKASDDRAIAVLDYDTLVEQSAEAAESTHPAQLQLVQTEGDAETPSMAHDEEHDWWSVRFEGKAKQGDELKSVRLELIVAGQAEE